MRALRRCTRLFSSQRVTDVSSRRQPSPIRALMPLAAQPGMISLGSGSPAPASFPVTNISVTLRDGSTVALGEAATAVAMQYSPTEGLPSLIRWVDELQRAEHNWHLGLQGRVCVTTGSQSALHLALQMLLEDGDTLLADEYCYPGTLETVRPIGVRVQGVGGDDDGMDPNALEAALERVSSSSSSSTRRPRVLYTIPTGHNPTGATMPNERRRRVYELCREHDLLILEDDPYWFLGLEEGAADESSAESFLAIDARHGDGRVLRFDSLSKVLSSGLRVGWVRSARFHSPLAPRPSPLAPRPSPLAPHSPSPSPSQVSGPAALVERIELHQQVAALHSSGLSQAVVAAVLENWGPEGWVAHCSATRALYRQRRDWMQASAEKHLHGLAHWNKPTHGMFLWLDLSPSGCTDSHALVKQRAVEAKVLLIPGSSFSAANPAAPSTFVRAAFSLASEEAMDTGLERLGELLRST